MAYFFFLYLIFQITQPDLLILHLKLIISLFNQITIYSKKQIIMKNFIQHFIAILVLLILLYLGINIIQNSRKINNNYQHFKQDTNTLIKKSKQKQKD